MKADIRHNTKIKLTIQKQMEMAQWLDDDRIPALNPWAGTELFARAFGCEVRYPGNNMPFAIPLIHCKIVEMILS